MGRSIGARKRNLVVLVEGSVNWQDNTIFINMRSLIFRAPGIQRFEYCNFDRTYLNKYYILGTWLYIYHTSLGSTSSDFFEFLNEAEGNHHGSGLKMGAKLAK